MPYPDMPYGRMERAMIWQSLSAAASAAIPSGWAMLSGASAGLGVGSIFGPFAGIAGAVAGAGVGALIAVSQRLVEVGKQLVEKTITLTNTFSDVSPAFAQMSLEQRRLTTEIRKKWAEELEPTARAWHERAMEFRRRQAEIEIRWHRAVGRLIDDLKNVGWHLADFGQRVEEVGVRVAEYFGNVYRQLRRLWTWNRTQREWAEVPGPLGERAREIWTKERLFWEAFREKYPDLAKTLRATLIFATETEGLRGLRMLSRAQREKLVKELEEERLVGYVDTSLIRRAGSPEEIIAAILEEVKRRERQEERREGVGVPPVRPQVHVNTQVNVKADPEAISRAVQDIHGRVMDALDEVRRNLDMEAYILRKNTEWTV